jgi:hypothetical protein
MMKRDGAIATDSPSRSPWPLLVVALAIAAMAAGVYFVASRDGQSSSIVSSTPARTPDWSVHVVRVNDAIARGNMTVAAYEWREAYGMALRSRRWEALLEVGDTAARMAAMSSDDGFRSEARRAYRAALGRAHAEKSSEGMRRVARAFRTLGDYEAAAHAERLAEQR